ncbi:hypothetical protein HanXRQr2_Chr09g0386711 [Helianthus annuus]|uniref:Uncharacterized protein n=2 Tax=Helianthus annuus TaxID=4232 RepID=A0A9K3I643_HELAN|nr:hypothetical protein HanXRQr2_Chr09g0386711 [Helianthus annuus]KAJ0893008.1 hypothetical protein HanPSC8_Chr09g0372691 [Helianthus annuus]
MGVRPLEVGEEYWYEEIKGHFMYPVAGAFANPPTATEGVLRDLGIGPEEKKKKPIKRKKVITLDAEVTSKKGGSSRAPASAADKEEDWNCWLKELWECGFSKPRCWSHSVFYRAR